MYEHTDDDSGDGAQLPEYVMNAPYRVGIATIDISAEAYYQARSAYEQVLEAGAELTFETLVLNNVGLEWAVTVDGEAFGPVRSTEREGTL